MSEGFGWEAEAKDGGVAPGRSRYRPALGAAICARVAAGESLRAICRDADMPTCKTVFNWAARREAFGAALAAAQAKARRAAAERRADVLAKTLARFAPQGRTGRPSGYDPVLAESICLRIAHGEGVSTICADPDMPCVATLFGWLGRHPEFEAQYARAREMQAHLKFDLAFDVARAATPQTVQVARLQVSVIRWQAAKLAPKTYGERAAAEAEPLTVHIRKWGENDWCDVEAAAK